MCEIQEFYSKRENCSTELLAARQKFGSRETTERQWEAIDRGLGLMYLYCPSDMQVLVHSAMLESTRRQSMLATLPLRRALCLE